MEDMDYAGFWWRALAHLIDLVILSICNCLLGMGLGIGLSVGMIAVGMDKGAILMACRVAGFFLGLIVYWIYYATMESSSWQATLGKRICKLTVTDLEGERLTFARASGRYWATWLSRLTCLVGYVMAAFTEKRQALHDIIAKTLVLREVE